MKLKEEYLKVVRKIYKITEELINFPMFIKYIRLKMFRHIEHQKIVK